MQISEYYPFSHNNAVQVDHKLEKAVTTTIVTAFSFNCIAHCLIIRLNRELNQVNRMNTTANIVCYKSKTLANGEHPLMIRICKDGKKKYLSESLGYSSEKITQVYLDRFDKEQMNTAMSNLL